MLKIKTILALACFILGSFLFYLGWKERDNLGAQIGDIIGSAPQEPMWMMVGGGVAILVGFALILRH